MGGCPSVVNTDLVCRRSSITSKRAALLGRLVKHMKEIKADSHNSAVCHPSGFPCIQMVFEQG